MPDEAHCPAASVRGESASPQLISVSEACRRLGIGKTKLHEMVARGRLPAVKLDSRTLIENAELQRFVESLPRVGAL